MTVLEIARQLLGQLPSSNSSGWIIDGGCHVGAFTHFALQEFPHARVLAFEPDPESWIKAQQNVGSHPSVEVVRAALGAARGRAEFFRGPFTATNSLLPRPDGSLKPYYPQQAYLQGGTTVEIVTIDEACTDRRIECIDVLKLDLQGGERAALQGAAKLLAAGAVHVIVTEAVFVRKYRDQPLLWEIWQLLEAFQYSIYSLEAVKVGLYHAEPSSLRHGQWNQCDAIFVSRAIRESMDR